MYTSCICRSFTQENWVTTQNGPSQHLKRQRKTKERFWGGGRYRRWPGKAQQTRVMLSCRFKPSPSPLMSISIDLESSVFLFLVQRWRHPYKWRFPYKCECPFAKTNLIFRAFLGSAVSEK